ncbi:MAG TPA: tetratricopeptide repeat protein [Candidatus Eisenbacteria bacterium]|nr:tetratricopeptide repeat protein [Candidatus Eisenbacteria bacterium]
MSKLSTVERLIRGGKWVAARNAIEKKLQVEPDNHWLLTRLGLTYYELRDYAASLPYCERALALAPRCPLVLWDYAGTLQMLGRHREAVEVYRGLIRRGAKRIAHGRCGEGLARARGLIADCHYRLADSLKALGRSDDALAEFTKHLDLRGPGCLSIYKLEKVNDPSQGARNHRPTA